MKAPLLILLRGVRQTPLTLYQKYRGCCSTFGGLTKVPRVVWCSSGSVYVSSDFWSLWFLVPRQSQTAWKLWRILKHTSREGFFSLRNWSSLCSFIDFGNFLNFLREWLKNMTSMKIVKQSYVFVMFLPGPVSVGCGRWLFHGIFAFWHDIFACLVFWHVGMLTCLHFGILASWPFNILACYLFVILAFWHLTFLHFGIEIYLSTSPAGSAKDPSKISQGPQQNRSWTLTKSAKYPSKLIQGPFFSLA